MIRTEFGRFTRQVSGYSLEHLLPENGADLAKFLAGTEGTLGMITGATVALVPSPKAVALAVLGYPGMPEAADAVPGLLPHRPVALEGMDARLVGVFRARRGDAAVPALPRGQAWLFVETAGDTEAEARAAAARLIADAGCLDSLVVTGAPARALWRVREDGAGLGSRTPADAPAWPGWEDAAVPPRQLGAYLRDFAALMAEHGLDGLSYGHFGDGCVHIRIDFPFSSAPGRYRRFVVAAAQLVGTYGGSMSGEHGDGRARSELLPAMYSAEAIEVMAAVKAIFDPGNVLNPGVLVDPAPLDADLRVPQARPLRRGLGFAYSHDGGDLSAAVHRCVGVGKCRADTTGSGGVMCPSWLATRDEKDSTRGRARVLQELANGSLVHGFARGGAGRVAGPVPVLQGLLVGLPGRGGHGHLQGRGAVPAVPAPAAPAGPLLAGLAAPLGPAGLARARAGQRRAARPGPGRAGQAAGRDRRHGGRCRGSPRRPSAPGSPPGPGVGGSQRAGTPVLLWVDTFTDYFTPEVGRAAVRVLEAAGYAVQITAEPVCCGLTWISTGQLDGARRQLRRSLRALGPALGDGVPVVGLEPSCTAVLRGEITELLPDDPRASRAKAATRTLAELLTGTGDWEPPDLGGVRAVAQPHCHHHAVMGWHADSALLARAGAEVTAVGGCCGLAGNFGVERGHYDVSAAVAETALLPAVRAAGDAVVLADGFSCRTQLDQLAGVSGTHLAQLLASRLAEPPA